MDVDKFLQIIDHKISAIDDLVNKSEEDPDFEQWHSSTKDLIAHAYGEKSRQFNEFSQIDYSVWVIFDHVDPQEQARRYDEGLKSAKAKLLSLKESAALYGLPGHSASRSTRPAPYQPAVTQNFYLTQSQVQSVKTNLDISSFDPDVREKVTELLTELEKPSSKDKGKITQLIKWLADKSIDVLIAILTASR